MFLLLLTTVTEFSIIGQSIIDELSLGGAAFRSLLWTLLFGAMLWTELKYRPREIPRPKRFGHSQGFHILVVTLLGLVFLANFVLTVALFLAALSV